MKDGGSREQGLDWRLAAVLVGGMILSAIVGFIFVNQVLLATISTAGAGDADAKALGSREAPVSVVVYSDFACGYCREFALGTEQQVIDEYVESGQVQLVYRHYAVLGEASVRAALAAEAAAEQGAFWAYHDALFQAASSGADAFSSEGLQRIAVSIGLDITAFNETRRAEETLARVEQDFNEARERGVSVVPTVFVGERKMEGALPTPLFQAAIEEALAESGSQ